MKKKKIAINLLCAVLLVVAILSGLIVCRDLADAWKSAHIFGELQQRVEEPIYAKSDTEESQPEKVEIQPETVEPPKEVPDPEALLLESYQSLHEENEDMVGWISLDGTGLNYPVMQTPDRPNYYLRRSFEKKYSFHGVPYVDEDCDLEYCNNVVIYGHNMKNGTMFSALMDYQDPTFRDEHPYIHFDTLEDCGVYEVFAAFRYNADTDSFWYHMYHDMNEAEFAEYLKECAARSLYRTDVDVAYGDKLLTLSTCEYSVENGRFVVVAKKVESEN